LPPTVFDWWDKAQHALAFLVLGGLGFFACAARSAQVALGLLAFGALIEVAQAATGWRYGDWQDWVAERWYWRSRYRFSGHAQQARDD